MIGRLLRRFRPDREPPPARIPPQPEIERDWAVGDRAECIMPGAWRDWPSRERISGPKRGEISKVAIVHRDGDGLWLGFVGFEPRRLYAAGNFRKLRPCSTDFNEQLRNRAPSSPAKKPVRLPAPRAIPELVP